MNGEESPSQPRHPCSLLYAHSPQPMCPKSVDICVPATERANTVAWLREEEVSTPHLLPLSLPLFPFFFGDSDIGGFFQPPGCVTGGSTVGYKRKSSNSLPNKAAFPTHVCYKGRPHLSLGFPVPCCVNVSIQLPFSIKRTKCSFGYVFLSLSSRGRGAVEG